MPVHIKMLMWGSQRLICPFNKDFFRIYYRARLYARYGEDEDKQDPVLPVKEFHV